MQRLLGRSTSLVFSASTINVYIRNSSMRCYSSNSFSTVHNRLSVNCVSFHNKRRYCSRIDLNGCESSEYSKEGLQEELIPKHIAIILDGSRRWLKSQGKPELDYEPFFEANTRVADLCIKWGVSTVTTFIYSLKNLQRGKEANDLLFGQLQKYLEDNLENFIRKEIRVSMVGEKCALPKPLQDVINHVEKKTREKDTKKLELMLAICYSGTRDIVEATRNISEKVKAGIIEPKDINEALLNEELWTSYAPHPDLLIRTGGRLRLSDYLMWQLAQTELYFTNIYGPEFGEDDFLEALRSFQRRVRTFGK